MNRIKQLIREVLSTPPKKESCNCGCHSCENVGNKGPVLNESLDARIVMTENMKYHVENKLSLTENTFRYSSQAFLDLWAEARYLYSRNVIHLNEDDKSIILETNLGEYGIYEGQKVPLDMPLLENEIGTSKDIDYPIQFRALSNLTGIVGEKIQQLKQEEEARGINFTGDLELLSKENKAIVQKRLRMLNLLKELDRLFSFENKEVNYNTVMSVLKQYDATDLLALVDAGLNENDEISNELGNEDDIELSFMDSTTPIIRDLYKKYKETGNEKYAEVYDKLVHTSPEKRQALINKYFPERLNESEDKKDPPLGKPKRGGSKKFYVYVRDPKTKNINKVSFGMAGGGLKAKLNNPKARQAFAKRHDCANKKDKTKASYWSCNLPRYAKLLGIKSNFSGYW
jgi:hypothetical protein